MAVTVIEIIGSREANISLDNPSKDLLFTIIGSDDDAVIRTAVEGALSETLSITSGFFGTLTLNIQNYSVKQKEPEIWEGVATYGRRQPRQTGDVVFSFDGTGATAHIATSKETIASYTRELLGQTIGDLALSSQFGGDLEDGETYYWVVTPVGPDNESLSGLEVTSTMGGGSNSVLLTWGEVDRAVSYRIYRSLTSNSYTSPCLVGTSSITQFVDRGQSLQAGAPPAEYPELLAPDYERAIGVNNDTVEGTDITVPVFKFTFTYYCPIALMTPAYIIQLMALTGTTNQADFKGFKTGEMLFLGPTGQQRSLDDWEIVMHFIGSPHVKDLTIGDILGIEKGGHEYLWVQFADSIKANKLIKVPEFAFVERVYDAGDYSKLGIGE